MMDAVSISQSLFPSPLTLRKLSEAFTERTMPADWKIWREEDTSELTLCVSRVVKSRTKRRRRANRSRQISRSGFSLAESDKNRALHMRTIEWNVVFQNGFGCWDLSCRKSTKDRCELEKREEKMLVKLR